MTVYFYSTREQYGEFSNFANFGVELDGLWWPSVEHYFQAQKFEDAAYREQIRVAHSAKEAANLGRSREMPLRNDWESVKESVMFRAVRKKIQTHPAVRELLLGTGDTPIIENAPGDYYWGCGKDGSGKNRLGEILMQVRGELNTT